MADIAAAADFTPDTRCQPEPPRRFSSPAAYIELPFLSFSFHDAEVLPLLLVTPSPGFIFAFRFAFAYAISPLIITAFAILMRCRLRSVFFIFHARLHDSTIKC